MALTSVQSIVSISPQILPTMASNCNFDYLYDRQPFLSLITGLIRVAQLFLDQMDQEKNDGATARLIRRSITVTFHFQTQVTEMTSCLKSKSLPMDKGDQTMTHQVPLFMKNPVLLCQNCSLHTM